MSFHIREVVIGASVDRFVHFSMLVVPGVRIFLQDPNDPRRRGPKEHIATLTEEELADAAHIAASQIRRWHDFSLPLTNGNRVTYYLSFETRPSTNRDVVRRTARDGTGHPVEDTRDVNARGFRSVMEEARRMNLDNVLVVHPHGPPGNSHVERIEANGDVRAYDDSWRGELMTWCGNLIAVGYEGIRVPGNLTIAHEMGHAMGLGHAVPRGESDDGGGAIMFGMDRGSRHLTRSDAVKLHRSAERGRSIPGVLSHGLRPRTYSSASGARGFRRAR